MCKEWFRRKEVPVVEKPSSGEFWVRGIADKQDLVIVRQAAEAASLPFAAIGTKQLRGLYGLNAGESRYTVLAANEEEKKRFLEKLEELKQKKV
jgi:hypothetical protein